MRVRARARGATDEEELRAVMRLVATDLCPRMTDEEFEDIWQGFIELRRLKAMQ